MKNPSVAIRLGGHEYRIRSEADPAWLQRVADHVDATMGRIRKHTTSVDSLEVALLAALNLARESIEAREATPEVADPKRLRALIELAESALEPGELEGAAGS